MSFGKTLIHICHGFMAIAGVILIAVPSGNTAFEADEAPLGKQHHQ